MPGCRLFILFLLVFIVPGAVQAQQKPASVLSLDQCIALALERHPLIRSSQYRHEASLARIKQVTAYPTPSVDFVSDLQPIFLDFVNSQEAYLGVSQTFELPRKRVERGRIAQQEANEGCRKSTVTAKMPSATCSSMRPAASASRFRNWQKYTAAKIPKRYFAKI